MHIEEIAIRDFGLVFGQQFCIYDTNRFCVVSEHNARAMRALAMYDEGGHAVCGQIFGLKDDGMWHAPFSAPFSAPSGTVTPETVNTFYTLAAKWLDTDLVLVWPPMVYNPPVQPTDPQAIVDVNYHYPMDRFANYEQYLSRSGRYNHHRWQKHKFECVHTTDVNRTYSIIERNRKAMGYPLAMSQLAVNTTLTVVRMHFFILFCEGEEAAAAIIYETAPGIVQVIYWGDLPQFRGMRAMNALAYLVFKWFADVRPDIHTIDIGPASTLGVRNQGLCDFKESIGCVATPKFTLTIQH